ncbi:MAG: pre-peptidase C-terminal domain-containing protein [Acidobacteriota bacterium]
MSLPSENGARRASTPAPRLCLTAGLVAGLLITHPAFSQAPAGYYDSVDTADANALRSTLHDVIDDHQRFPYTASSTDVWDILNLADEDPNDMGRIVDIYKNASYAKISGGQGAYNREHVWPKSYGFPDDGSSNYPYTDCHHLFASDVSYNAERSNKPFRNCDAGCQEWTTNNTDGRGGGSGVFPGNSNWTEGDFYQGTWETWGGRKGDVARAVFYMDIRYEGGSHGGTGASEPDLRLTDDENQIEAYRTGNNENVAYMGMRSVLLQWHLDDPVDARELYRNEVVYGFQGNRNPFIDHPEWVDCLYNGVGCGGGGGGACPDCVDFQATATVSYSNQDNAGNVQVQDGGATLYLEDNTWRRTTATYDVSASTVLEFDFKSTAEGELHGIGFDEDDTLTNDARLFKLYGTQNWSGDIDGAASYTGGGAWQSFSIPVGTYYTGAGMRLVLMNDNDAGANNTSFFRNVRVTSGGGGGGGGGGNTLSNGVPASGLSGAQGEQTFFTLAVPTGASDLSFALSGGSGDADLYVRFGAPPTTSDYDCRPWLTGNNETCDVTAQAGTWYVMIAGYSAYSGASLVGSYSTGGGGGGCTPATLDLSGLSGSAGTELRYTVDVPSCAGSLSVQMSGGSGDADLYVRFGSPPDTSTYDCRPYLNGNSETCSFQAPQAGTWHVMVRGYSTFSGVGLDALAQ